MDAQLEVAEQSSSKTDADRYEAFRARLFGAGLIVETGVDGLYGKSAAYEGIVGGIDRLVTQRIVDQPSEVLSFPPVLARWVFDKTDYLKSFPDLMGSVHTFRGTDRQHAQLVSLYDEGGDWPGALTPAQVVLTSATCHPVYPLCTGSLPPGGRRFEVNGYCFRCEPSIDPTRMQAFRMHEYVYVGDPDTAQTHRDEGLGRGIDLLSDLGLDVSSVEANDPFFGRLGVMLATNQRDEALKMEVVTPVCSAEHPTAIMSANCARDHFGSPFGIVDSEGRTAHSACVAFGIDRITLALLKTHGLDTAAWPSAVRAQLWA
jgi:seryl-tRNA synthetase